MYLVPSLGPYPCSNAPCPCNVGPHVSTTTSPFGELIKQTANRKIPSCLMGLRSFKSYRYEFYSEII